MWYVILCKDRPNSLSLRLEGRKAHRERLVKLQNEGRLLVAG
ncbi:MAG: YciI family protein, partial [Methylophilaceae bacterium]|nr:YciI family protein [Methylophilaceae bacterium]